MAPEEAGRNEIRLVDRSACVTAADCGKDLVAQPTEVCLQLGQHVGRGEVPRQRLMTVQHVARIFLDHYVNRIEQTLQVSFYNERRTDIRHDEIADKENAQIPHMDQNSLLLFSPVHANHFYHLPPTF